jgi:CubicO group peptidase (beta-lactamase class C family)
MSRLARALISLALLTGILSCARDTRPYETRVQEALREGLQEFNVKGASVAVIMPDGRIYKVVAGFSHDRVAIHPDMLFAIGSITE